jgi:hypothetical protein
MDTNPIKRAARGAVLLLALTLMAGSASLRAETRSFTSTSGTTITAEPVSHDGAGTLTLKLANGTTTEVPVDKLSAADQDWAAEWIKSQPAERSYHFSYEVVEKKLADLERTSGTYVRTKKQRWAYGVTVTNADRRPVSDLTLRYRVYMRDEVSGYDGIGLRYRNEAGESFQQKGGEEKMVGEMRFNDHKEFVSESFDLDETRYSYYYSRSTRTKDRLAGIIIKIYDRTGRVVDTYRSDEKWLASVEWEDEAVAGVDPGGPPMRRRPGPAGVPTVPEPAAKTTRMGGSRVSIPGAGTVRPVKGTASAAKTILLDAKGVAVPVTFLASMVAGGADAGAMPVYFTSEVSRDFGSRLSELGGAMGSANGGWPEGLDASLTWSAAFDPADGAAGSAACALALDALIQGIVLDPEVTVIAPLGGDLAAGTQKQLGTRLSAAAKDPSCSVVLVGPGSQDPIGDLILTGDVDPLWKVQVIEAADLAALRSLARNDRETKLQAAMDEFASVRMLIEAGGTAAIKSPAALASLKRVAAAVPGHLSATTLLAYASGQGPSALSLSGSYDILWNSAGPFIGAVRQHLGGKSADVESTRSALSDVRRLRPKMNAKVLDLVDAIADMEAMWRDYSGRGGQGPASPLYNELRQATIKVTKLAEAVEAAL